MELKYFLSEINDLRIHESNNELSEWGKDKLKEYEFILTELAKKLQVPDVSGECLHPFNAIKEDKITELRSCLICGKQWY